MLVVQNHINNHNKQQNKPQNHRVVMSVNMFVMLVMDVNSALMRGMGVSVVDMVLILVKSVNVMIANICFLMLVKAGTADCGVLHRLAHITSVSTRHNQINTHNKHQYHSNSHNNHQSHINFRNNHPKHVSHVHCLPS